MPRDRRLLGRWALALLLVAGLALVTVRWLARGRLANERAAFEQAVGALDFAAFALAPLPDAANAAYWLVAGSRAVAIPDGRLGELRALARLPATAWSDDERRTAAELLEPNAEALARLGQARAAAGSTFGIDYASGPEARIPNLLELVRAGRLQLVEVKLAVADGNVERALAGLGVLERLAGALGRESTLITTIVSLAAHHLLLEAVHDVLAVAADPIRLHEIVGRLERLTPRDTVRRGIQGEATFAVTLPATAAHGGGRPPGPFDALRYRVFEDLFRAGLLAEYRELATRLDEPWSHLELADRQGSLRPGLWARHSPLWVDLMETVARLKAVESSRELALAALRLRLRAVEEGRLPPTLAFRSPDPYSGKPFSYRLEPDGRAVVASPEAEEAWLARRPEGGERRQPRFRYEVGTAGP